MKLSKTFKIILTALAIIIILIVLTYVSWVFLIKTSEETVEERFKQAETVLKETEREVEIINSRIIADMNQIRNIAEIIYSGEGSYRSLNCINPQISPICKDIADQVRENPIIHSSPGSYCAYTRIYEHLLLVGYYCVDSQLTTKKVFSPGEKGYCDGITFVCPPY